MIHSVPALMEACMSIRKHASERPRSWEEPTGPGLSVGYLEKRGSAWLRFLFRANAFPGQNTEHARLEEVDAEWFGFIKGERTRRP